MRNTDYSLDYLVDSLEGLIDDLGLEIVSVARF